MSFNAAKQGRHAGTHEDQYRTAKQARLDARAEIEDQVEGMRVRKFRVGDRVRSKTSGQVGTISRTPQFRNDYYRVTWDEDSIRFGTTVSKIGPLTLTYYFDRLESN